MVNGINSLLFSDFVGPIICTLVYKTIVWLMLLLSICYKVVTLSGFHCIYKKAIGSSQQNNCDLLTHKLTTLRMCDAPMIIHNAET
jgi:hypothetical protein